MNETRRNAATKIITYDSVSQVRDRHRSERIVLVSGAFDLLHLGHVRFLDNAQALGEVLVVGGGSDVDVKRYKSKDRPFYNEEERLKSVAALEAVDYCFVTYAPEEGKGHFLDWLKHTFSHLRPDFYVFNNDTFDIPYRLELAGSHKVAVKILEDFYKVNGEALSTTKILERVSAMPKLR